MGGRLRRDINRAFECFAEVWAPDLGSEPGAKGSGGGIRRTFPSWYKERQAEQLKSVPQFVFPCSGIAVPTVQNFSFVLTNLEAQWTFGFVRHSPNAESALVMLSSLPWHETFYRVLNHAAELRNSKDEGELDRFLEAVYKSKLPDPGTVFHITWEATPYGDRRDFTCPIPSEHGLPSIPENRNLTEYYNAVGIHSMLVIFASMLFERRIIVTSKRLSRLSACVQAANAIIYPMHWQHIFIPVLPMQLIDYLSAPMPFLVGVPAPIMAKVKPHELGEVVVLDADTNVIRSPFSDLEYLPTEVTANLKRSLKSHRNLLGDSVARAFLQALVHLIGGYRDALKFRQGEKITFSDEAFVSSRSGTLQPFLEQMLQLQIFRQFVEERLTMLNTGRGFSDEFEDEVIRFQEAQNNNSKLKQQYAQISSSVKKEGGALVKAVRSKLSIKSRLRTQSALNQWAATYPDKYKSANPAVKSAVKSVKHGSRGLSTKSKSAYREMRSKMKTSSSGSLTREGTLQPSSAPSSPVLGHRASSFSSMSSIGSFTSTQHIPSSLAFSATPPVNDSGSSQGSSGFGSGGNRIQGLARNNTDLGFGRVLKYERFDPPALAGVPRNPFASNNPHTQLIADQSPEMEGPKPLDLDLMSDLQDVIFKANNLNNNQEPQNTGHTTLASTPRAPPINRHLKPNLRRSLASYASAPCLEDSNSLEYENHQDSSFEEDAGRSESSTPNGHTPHPAVARQHALGPEKARKSSAGDLIKLDSKSFEEDQDIFDPLFQPASSSNNHRPSPQLPMPKPPSASTLPQIAKLFEQQAHVQPQNHKPLQRSSGPTSHNPFQGQNGNPTSSLRPQGVMPNRALFTKSSDDLLQEYGIDFNALSVAGSSGNHLSNSNTTTTAITSGNNSGSSNIGGGFLSNNGHPMRLLTAQGSNPTKDPGLNPFADLDPLSAKQVGPAQSVNHLPLAPPRGVKKQHWTTFE